MIWLLELPEGLTEAALRPLLPLLDADRQQRLARYRVEQSRVESVLAGALLRHAYGQEYCTAPPEIARGLYGKPEFTGPDAPQFNLSHCSRAVACALSRFPVGVDVQELRPYSDKFRRVLSERERTWVEEADADRRFTALWTRKEAFGKALGVGLGYSLQTTEFAGSYDRPRPCGDRLLWTLAYGGGYLSCCAQEPLALQKVTPEQFEIWRNQ